MNVLSCTVLVITDFNIPQYMYFIKSFKGGLRQNAESHLSTLARFS